MVTGAFTRTDVDGAANHAEDVTVCPEVEKLGFFAELSLLSSLCRPG